MYSIHCKKLLVLIQGLEQEDMSGNTVFCAATTLFYFECVG